MQRLGRYRKSGFLFCEVIDFEKSFITADMRTVGDACCGLYTEKIRKKHY